jgi:hypothetical protein
LVRQRNAWLDPGVHEQKITAFETWGEISQESSM